MRYVSRCLGAVAILLASAVRAQVCHDGIWDVDEFCGRDAFVVTGVAEMNHDCIVDVLDNGLLALQIGMVGPNLSGDFDANGNVDSTDLSFLSQSLGSTVPECVAGGMRPDEVGGLIALSFDADPTNIVSTTSLEVGTIGFVNLVVDRITAAHTIEFGIEASSNINILGSSPIGSSPCQSAFFKTAVSGPTILTIISFVLTAPGPATFEITTAGCPPYRQRIRWADAPHDRSIEFCEIGNAGVNGPAPLGSSCLGVDIRPDRLNPRSRGQIPVAILGSSSVNVANLDPTSLVLEGVPSSSTQFGSAGNMGLTAFFDTQAVLGAIGSVNVGSEIPLRLKATLLPEFGGHELQGEDSVVIVGGMSKTSTAQFKVHQNDPNPFNPQTTIRFELPGSSVYSVSIFDVAGRLVWRYEGSGGPGALAVGWDGTDAQGRRVESGLYFYSVRAGKFSETRKMVLLQ